MAASRYPTQQLLAGQFVVSAGSVLFRLNRQRQTTSEPIASTIPALEICVLHQTVRDEWLLPKGRKDRGESVEAAAIRETYEETGYRCRLWPQRMPTRAPAPGVFDVHVPEMVEDLVEPVAVTIRQLGESRGVKLVYWFISLAAEGAEKVEGSQMANESFESCFMEPEEAIARLTFQSDREIVRKALDIVRDGVSSEL
ncbi:hypothetical protein D9619_009464 [Psilocybe cf. subviscida]|uniref:Nudix hydrolase domain-containing protein n=1 Tax=Psilocybe cf. subviscida TaxID=2480587 RepID=A0A8H5BWH1_9AGAR|nr:hypothetical protein D9619_009464 [Psilocybe cf. subviscida]